ncbi:hypothetical protein P5V15_009275 [Pogonomyrmex californicus]
MKSKRAILETIQQQALCNFQLGLLDDIKLLVRSQHYTTLQDAIASASAEQKFKESMENFGRAKVNTIRTSARENKLPQCQRCGKIGRDCRTSRYTNRFSLPRAEKLIGVNAMEKYCVNCKKAGHDKKECWLKPNGSERKQVRRPR